jgi:hypothetical protein
LSLEELLVFENESMLKACERLCNRKPTVDCPDWCIVKILDDNFRYHMEMNKPEIAEDYARMLQKEDVLKRAQNRLKCTHIWTEIQSGGVKCPICGAIYIKKLQKGGKEKPSS